MRHKLLITLLFFASLQSVKTFSQARLGTYSVNFPDTVTIGDNISIDVTIQNKGNVAYSGFVDILYKTKKTPATQLNTVAFYSVSLNPGDTISFHIQNFTFSPAFFTSGKDVVVVWPTGTTSAPSDSLTDTIFVNYPVNIQGIMQPNEIVLSPNPVIDELYITCNNNHLCDIESIRIFDMIGNEYSIKKQFENELDLTFLPSGMYVVNLRFKDGTFISRRFVKGYS